MIEVAALCIGVGCLLSFSSSSNKIKAQNLARATRIDELKGLEVFLDKEPLCNSVVVFGTVGSNSPIENNRSGALCVFSEETATICLKREENRTRVPAEECRNVMLNRKEVSWYLDDGTGRVDVMHAQFSIGFYDTLSKYIFDQPVTQHLERFFSFKDIQIIANSCCEHVLEIGKPLTVVGEAEKDKDGAITIKRVYQVFNGRVNIDELASDLKSNSEYYGRFSLFLAGIGVTILAVSVLRIPLDFS